jgi:Flp pilus assembly protein CpaB
VLAVSCLLAAAVAGLQRPPLASVPAGGAPAGVPVLVAAADLAAGARLTAADVRAVPIPDDLVPAGALRPSAGVLGRIVAGPMRRGEPLTDARLLGRGLATGLSPPESVAVPVRLADGQTAALVRPGDRIDVLATPVDGAVGSPAAAAPPGGTSAAASDPAVAADPPGATGATGRPAGAGSAVDATVLAAALRVLAVLADPHASATDGALVVVATSDRVARRLTAAAAQQRLSIALRPP